MKKIDDPFLSILPKIDLHGFDKISAIIKTKEFIEDNLKLGNYKLIIIHGKGERILKTSIHEYLNKDKYVNNYKLDNFNDGVTIVDLGGKNE